MIIGIMPAPTPRARVRVLLLVPGLGRAGLVALALHTSNGPVLRASSQAAARGPGREPQAGAGRAVSTRARRRPHAGLGQHKPGKARIGPRLEAGPAGSLPVRWQGRTQRGRRLRRQSAGRGPRSESAF